MSLSFVKPSADEGAPSKLLSINDLGEPPPLAARTLIIQTILAGPPDIFLFHHYWWLTSKPVPPRHNLQTNDQYVSRNWWRLRKAAEEYVLPATNDLDILPPTS